MKARSDDYPHEQPHNKTPTRYERIRSMSASELAFFLMGIAKAHNKYVGSISVIGGKEMYDDKDCLFWLLEESKEGEL